MIKLTLSALVTGLILLVLPKGVPARMQEQGQAASGEDVLFNTTLLGRARKAKARGATEATFPGPVGIPVFVRNWEEVLSHFSLTVAKPVA